MLALTFTKRAGEVAKSFDALSQQLAQATVTGKTISDGTIARIDALLLKFPPWFQKVTAEALDGRVSVEDGRVIQLEEFEREVLSVAKSIEAETGAASRVVPPPPSVDKKSWLDEIKEGSVLVILGIVGLWVVLRD